jgi:hypothetical protein
MAGRHSSAPTAHADFGTDLAIRVCSRRIPDENRERKAMHAATTRSIIAAAALAAIGLAAWPHQATQPLAQQGVPIVHRDVALVDVTDATLLTDEGTLDSALVSDVLGPKGAEEVLLSDLSTATSPTEAETLLDTGSATPPFSGDFNGAETAGFNGLYLDTLASEDEGNQLLGISDTTSQTAILADLTAEDPTAVTSADLTALTGAVGTSAFDTDLTSYANADFSLAVTDFEGYLASFATDTSGLSDVSTILTDLSSSFSDLSTLTPDLSSILTDLGGLL